ncbi:hypothetical protein VNO78_12471 [Psophocarpus tetragonolobus]|uniref:DUF7610 domain-containing protein n=1 Tax=Psophocarpus tetragonolobus TaxID=3891 RepID=A0AAN9XPW3_PSOTE
MDKDYKNLHAKLTELQAILDEALLLGPKTQSQDSISNEIKNKLAFAGNLLSAEAASDPSKPHHLHHISEMLSTMQRNFHHWDSFRSLPCHDFDKDHSSCSCTDDHETDLVEDPEELFANFEKASGYVEEEKQRGSGTDDHETDLVEDPEKLFPDCNCEKAKGYVGEEKLREEMKNELGKFASLEYEDAEEYFQEFEGEMELVEFEFDGEKNNDLEREERRHNATFGERCCALACGVVIGMILMGFIMVNGFSGRLNYADEASFSVPT